VKRDAERDRLLHVLEQFRGFAAPLRLWESEILPRRIDDYNSKNLDAMIQGDQWTWRAAADSPSAEVRVAFVPRGFAGGAWPRFPDPDASGSDATEVNVLECLRTRGASYVDELATSLAATPTEIRRSLDALVRRGLVVNDRFEAFRYGGQSRRASLERAGASRGARDPFLHARRRGLGTRPASLEVSEGRWAAIPARDSTHGSDESLLEWAGALLDRYGVLTKETMASDTWAPAWSDLLPVLSRAEWRGHIQRGYFVDGYSGIQFAARESVETLQSFAACAASDAQPIVVCVLDPACPPAGSAPFDDAASGTNPTRWNRVESNHVVIMRGEPILLFESAGRRVSTFAGISEADRHAAVGALIGLASPQRRQVRIETYNDQPVRLTEARSWLADAGFVADLHGMTFFAGPTF
jgi:ATP-dependent Lhr-like helicase